MADFVKDEKIEMFEQEKLKRRRVGRLMIFWIRFRRHRMGVFGLFIIFFVTLVGLLAPFLAGEGRLVPYDPSAPNLEARFLPPLSYESTKDTKASQELSDYKKTIAAVYVDFQMNFTNGISEASLPYYNQLSRIDSIISDPSGQELWSSSIDPSNQLNETGFLTLPSSYSGMALIDFRTGGKIAMKFTPTKTSLSYIKIYLKTETKVQEEVWDSEIYAYLYKANEDLTSTNYFADGKIEGYSVFTGGTSINPGLVKFRFGTQAIIPDEDYIVVIDANILNVESAIDQQLYTLSSGDALDPLHQNNQHWNAITGWNTEYTTQEEGWTTFYRVYYQTDKFHVFGTDAIGHDILSATIWGATASLTVAIIAQSIAIIAGILVGGIAGYYSGKIDNILMRFTDIILAVPFFFLLLIAVTIWEQISLPFMAITIGILSWPGIARIVRAQFLSLRELEYTEAAKALGVSDGSIIFKHLLPNALAPVIVQATLGTAAVILTEAGLSFLGFGDPLAVSWGTAIQWGMTENTLRFAPWVATIPGLAIFVVVLAFNLMGDGLRDALDPRLKN
ncbi:MAG: ABC transporter permease [Candidatus Hodarchaeota archaeon]